MKNMRKYIIVFAFVFVAMIILSSCNKNEITIDNMPTTKKEEVRLSNNHYFTENEDFISYCAKEDNDENNIYFNYPLFKDSVINSDKLNKIILSYVEDNCEVDENGFTGELKGSPMQWNWRSDSERNTLKIDYDIMFYGTDYISIIFYGYRNYIKSPHPNSYYMALTIDLKKNKEVKLADLYNVNDEFLHIIKEESRKQIVDKDIKDDTNKENAVFGYLGVFSDQNNNILNPLEYFQDNNFFMTEKELAIIIYLSHADGDYVVVYIDYEMLKLFRK